MARPIARGDTVASAPGSAALAQPTTPVSTVPVGRAGTGGAVPVRDCTDALLLIGVGAVAGSLGLFGAARAAGRPG